MDVLVDMHLSQFEPEAQVVQVWLSLRVLLAVVSMKVAGQVMQLASVLQAVSATQEVPERV